MRARLRPAGFGDAAGRVGLPSPRMSERSRNLPRRTCLAVPGSSEKMLGKAPGLGADMVFLDLEDSVAPLEKEAARDNVVQGDQRARLGRHRRLRARERVGHEVDVPRRRSTWSRTRRSGSTRSCCRRCSRRATSSRSTCCSRRSSRSPAARPRRHRGADRDRARPHQRRGDLRGVAAHGDDRVRSRRLRGVDRDAGAHRRRADPRVPGRPLPLRVRQDPHGRARQRPAGDRRPVPQDPRARRAARLRDAHPHPRLRRQVGAAPRPGRR